MHYLPCDAMLAWYMLWPCVCLSQVGVLLKWLNIGSCRQHHTIELQFPDAKGLSEIPPVNPYGGAKCRWGGLKCCSVFISLTLTRITLKVVGVFAQYF